MVMPEILVNDTLARKALEHVGNVVSDFTPFWDDLLEVFFELETERFRTEGYGSWAPLSPRYAAWKAMHYGGQPLLVRQGELRTAATGGTGVKVLREPYSLAVSIETPTYWRFHQTGTSRMPQRKVFETRQQDRQQMVDAMAKKLGGMVK